MTQSPIAITGVWLRRFRDHIEVLIERGGVWYQVMEETNADGPISHIVEPAGMLKAPVDKLTQR